MVAPDGSLEVLHADCDASSGAIFVEGETGAGVVACLMPRRYRKQPEWWVIDVAALDAPTDIAQRFRLSCVAEGIWGTRGIEVVGPNSALRIPRVEQSETETRPETETQPETDSEMAEAQRKLNPHARMISSSDDG